MTLFMLAAYGFICAAVYHLCPAQIRWAVLLLASYGFYASRSLAGLPFILLTTVFHVAGRAGYRLNRRKRQSPNQCGGQGTEKSDQGADQAQTTRGDARGAFT